MAQLILHPTELSQWYACVSEAQVASQLMLRENMESYLVFLLMRFSQAPRFVESIIALDFLESMHKPRSVQPALFRDIGDKSLLFCGLFPGIAAKRRVGLHYFTDLGQAAYLNASGVDESSFSELFVQLSEQFLDLQQILQAMRKDILHIIVPELQ